MLFAFVSISAHKLRIRRKPIWTLIDTGSPWVALTPPDSLMLNVPLSALRTAPEYPIVNFGAYKFRRLLLKDVSIIMRDEARRTVSLGISSITVLKPTKKMPSGKFKSLPSVLGVDFIRENNLELHFSPAKNEAFLHKE